MSLFPSTLSVSKDWVPGTYGTANSIVYYSDLDGVAHRMRLVAAVPYNSLNLRTEFLAGDWQRVDGGACMMKNEFVPADNVPVDIGSGPGGLIMCGDNFRIGGIISTDGNGRELVGGASWLISVKDNPGAGAADWKINNG
jgi:hypothetical protein